MGKLTKRRESRQLFLDMRPILSTMSDKTRTTALPTSSINAAEEKSSLHLRETTPLQQRIATLLRQVAQETEQFNKSIEELLTQIEALREARTTSVDSEGLVLQLREANQNLVLAALGAQEMQEKAEAINLRQEEFLSMLAHELRNPLAPVAMAAEILHGITSAHPELPKLHGIIARQTDHMIRLVDDLLDASRVSSGKIALHKRPRLLSEIIESAVETSQPFIDKRNQQLTVKLLAKPVVINGDLVRLAQVFSNLLINASKFTPEFGKINVSAHMLDNAVTVVVKDNGVGIAADIQPFIFDMFTQGYRSLERSQGGLGVGLSLVRTIAEMHGGTATVHSDGEGEGSEFAVRLPIEAEAQWEDLETEADVISSLPCRILIIEDNADLNDTMREALETQGHTMMSAFDGASGLSMAKKSAYDIIICDIGLPGMNGYEVVKQLRLQSSKPMPYLIALSGYSQPDNRSRSEEAGFDHYLVKPVALKVLAKLIASRCSV